MFTSMLNDGKLLEFRSKKVIAGKLTDIEYLKQALDTKLSGGYSKKYTDMLSYCYRLIHDEIQNSKVDSKAIKNILSRYVSGVSYNTLKRHLIALINEARSGESSLIQWKAYYQEKTRQNFINLLMM